MRESPTLMSQVYGRSAPARSPSRDSCTRAALSTARSGSACRIKEMIMKRFMILRAFAIIAGSEVLSAQQLTDDQIQQQLLSQPPAAAVTSAQRLAKNGVLPPIAVDWIRADLDGSGLFQFLIARFAVQNSG